MLRGQYLKTEETQTQTQARTHTHTPAVEALHSLEHQPPRQPRVPQRTYFRREMRVEQHGHICTRVIAQEHPPEA